MTVYAATTKSDFTIPRGIIFVLITSLLMLGLLGIFWRHNSFLEKLYCTLGAIIFGIYLVIDTQMIIGGKRYSLSFDDYIVGALVLYIDIINLFLYILRLLRR